jgi:sulfite reductase alpha subunit-like flavoprotein
MHVTSTREALSSQPHTHNRYVTGDYLGVFPRNHPELVAQYAARLAVPLDTVLNFDVRPDSKGKGVLNTIWSQESETESGSHTTQRSHAALRHTMHA